jgi:lysozyme
MAISRDLRPCAVVVAGALARPQVVEGAAVKTSPAGIKAIEGYEGCRLTAYQDSVGVWTIGVGHTIGVVPGMTITQEEADDLLAEDLANAEAAVNSLVKVPLSQPQFDALASLVFNIGPGAFRSSTLLRKLNAGDYEGAAAEFPRWCRAGDQILPGLEKRRAAEAAMFKETAYA